MMDNLDAMSADDLMAFWLKHQRGRRAIELFPLMYEGIADRIYNDLPAFARW